MFWQMTTFHTINFGKTKSLSKGGNIIIQNQGTRSPFKLRTPQSICLPILLKLIVCLAIKAPGHKIWLLPTQGIIKAYEIIDKLQGLKLGLQIQDKLSVHTKCIGNYKIDMNTKICVDYACN